MASFNDKEASSEHRSSCADISRPHALSKAFQVANDGWDAYAQLSTVVALSEPPMDIQEACVRYLELAKGSLSEKLVATDSIKLRNRMALLVLRIWETRMMALASR